MKPFSKLIKSSDGFFGKWVLFGTVVKGTWAVASVGSLAFGCINAVVGFIIPFVNLIFAFLFEANVGIPLFGHGEGIFRVLTISSLEEWLSIKETLGIIIREFVGAGTKTSGVHTNIHEVGSRVAVILDIRVSAFIAFDIIFTQTGLATRTESSLFNFSHVFVRIIAHSQHFVLFFLVFEFKLRDEGIILKLFLNEIKEILVIALSKVELTSKIESS